MAGRLFVILPVYNEGRAIHDLLAVYDRLLAELGLAHCLLVIDDCSADDSPQWIARAQRDFPGLNITAHRHAANQGLAGALNTGLGLLEGFTDEDLLVTMDGDNTHNPMLLKEMLSKVEQGADIVIASRYCEQSRISGLDPLRVLLSHGASWLYRLRWGIPGVKDYTCLYRLYAGPVVRRFLDAGAAPHLAEKGFTCSSELLRKMARQAQVCVESPMILRYANKVGASNMRLMKTIAGTLKLLGRR